MIARLLHRCGLRAGHLHSASLATIALSLSLWIRAKTEDQEQRGNAERRAIFVGLWPASFYLLGDTLEGYERRRRKRWRS
jgi:uncharacterized membrane protein